VNQWIGWALSQPFSLLLAIPALGIVFDVVSTIGRNRLPQRSVAFGAIGVVAVTALATVTQTSITLPWEGEKFLDDAGTKIADLLPFLLLNVVPVLGLLGILGLTLLTLKSSKPVISAPVTFVVIGLLGILLGAAAHIVGLVEDAGVIGSIYEAGVYVPITFGAIAIAFGGICYWGPKLWGRSISDKAATPLALLALLAIGLDSIPYFIAGFADQPTGLVNGFSYSGPQDLWNALTCAGFVVMLLASIAFVGLAIKSFTSGATAGNDPWDGTTLEWATSSPPPAENFADVIVVNSATPLTDIKSASSTGKVA
jgi:heme/copper-type cytochrome/quinol oxidase subunit 1